MIKYGYFEIDNVESPGNENYQIPISDFIIELDTGLHLAPDKILCTYIDDSQTYSLGVCNFFGSAVCNGYAFEYSSQAFKSENVDFRNSNARYVKYDELTGKLFLHIEQWVVTKCGKWMWIAIYKE